MIGQSNRNHIGYFFTRMTKGTPNSRKVFTETINALREIFSVCNNLFVTQKVRKQEFMSPEWP